MKKYKLTNPITIQKDNKEISLKEVEIADFKVKHLRFFPKDSFSGEPSPPYEYIPLISNITNTEAELIEEMDIQDFMNIIEAVTSDMGESKDSQKNGKT